MRKFIKRFKNSILGKILRFIFKIIMWLIEIAIIAIAIVIIVQRFTNNQKSFFGYRIFNVASGSMEPDYVVGDILISKEKDPSTIKVGDNVVYIGTKSDYKGKIITHSVVQIEQNEKGEYLFHTKGIANTIEDPIVHQDQLYGVVVDNNEVLAFICRVLTNKYGLYFVVILPIILYAFVQFVKIQGKKIEQEREEEQSRKKQEQLEEEKKKKQELEHKEEQEQQEEKEEQKQQEEKQEEDKEQVENEEDKNVKPKKTRTKKSKKAEESKKEEAL